MKYITLALSTVVLAGIGLTVNSPSALAGCCQVVGKTPGMMKGIGAIPTAMSTERRGIPAELLVNCTCKGTAVLVDPNSGAGVSPPVDGAIVRHSFGDDTVANTGTNSTALPLIVGTNRLKIHTHVQRNYPIPAESDYTANIQLQLP
jgi:hypothetical protein